MKNQRYSQHQNQHRGKFIQVTGISVCILALLSGCTNRNSNPQVISAQGNDRGEWLCEAGKSSDDWDCIQSQDIKPKLAERAARQAAEPTTPPPSTPTSGPLAPITTPQPNPLAEPLGGTGPSEFGDTVINQSSNPATQQPPSAAPPPPADPDSAMRQRPRSAPVTDEQPDNRAHPADLPAYAKFAYRPTDPVRIIDLPEEFFAAQLLAVSSKEQIEEFVVAQNLYNMSAARIERDGQFLYVLLLGVYETKENALQAVASMPKPVQNMRPWIRPVAGLQQAMLRADRLASTAGLL